MSRIQEGIALRTDAERFVWFNSLTPDERVEVTAEANQIIDKAVEVWQPMQDALAAWWKSTEPIIQDFCAKITAVRKEYDKSHTDRAV